MTTRSGTWIGMPRRRRAGVLPDVLAALAAALERRRQRARLATLEPRLLRDIGATAEEAWHEAHKPCWRR